MSVFECSSNYAQLYTILLFTACCILYAGITEIQRVCFFCSLLIAHFLVFLQEIDVSFFSVCFALSFVHLIWVIYDCLNIFSSISFISSCFVYGNVLNTNITLHVAVIDCCSAKCCIFDVLL